MGRGTINSSFFFFIVIKTRICYLPFRLRNVITGKLVRALFEAPRAHPWVCGAFVYASGATGRIERSETEREERRSIFGR